MSTNPWHRRYHSDALSGMLSLTLEERGAYQTVLDLIYDRGGPIADNERLLAGYMGCSIRKWRSLRERLIEKGKLIACGDRISNARAEKEIENDAKTRRKLAENGSKGGRKKAETGKNANKYSAADIARLEQNSSLIPEARSQSIPLSNDNGDFDDPSKQLWSAAISYLGEKRRPLIGKWCSEFGQVETAKAITEAQHARAADPVSYIVKVLKGQSTGTFEYAGGPC